MNTLPYEIIEMILVYLNREEVLKIVLLSNFFRYSKIWNFLCNKHYNIDNLKGCKKLKQKGGWQLYNRMFKDLCVICSSRTHSKDIFYNITLCKSCQFSCNKYSTISKSRTERIYKLKYEEFNHLHSITQRLRIGGKTIYGEFFLEKEIQELYYKFNLKQI